MNFHVRKRKYVNRLAIGLAMLVTGIGLLIPFWIIFTVIQRGMTAFNSTLFTQMTPPPDAVGGLLNAIVGSLMMVGIASLIATPIGVMTGVYLSEYGRRSRLGTTVRFVNDILLSAPSIVIGLFVYMVLVIPMRHFSGIAGVAALAIIALPIIIRTTENILLLVPDNLREGSYALGSSRRQAIMRVCLPAARNGIITGILLSVARISGETAPLLFTALNNQYFSTDLNHPMANLPVVIFQFAMSPYDNWQALAWAGAALITVTVVLLNLATRVFFSDRSTHR